jgi:hypothetical protein
MLLINDTGALLHEYQRDVRFAARKKKSADGPTLWSFVKFIPHYCIRSFQLAIRSSSLNLLTKLIIAKDHRKFLKGTLAERDEIYSRWQKIAEAIQHNGAIFNDIDNSPMLLKPTLRNMLELMSLCLNFENRLKTELDNYVNITLSQEYLKELHAKFSHLPKEMLDDMHSDKYSECV